MLSEEEHEVFVASVSKSLKKLIGTKKMRFFGTFRWGAAEVSAVAIDGDSEDNSIAYNVICYEIGREYYLYCTPDDEFMDESNAIASQSDFNSWIREFDQDDLPFKAFPSLADALDDVDRGIDKLMSNYMTADWK